MDVKSSLLSSIEEVLDKMAFMFFDESEPPEAEPDDFPFITEVDTRGVIVGKLNVLVTETSAREIARNLIGIRDDEELYPETLEDALREFTNLVMGRTMTILNPAGPFDMDVPRLVSHPAPREVGRVLLTINGALDDEPFQMMLQYEEQQAAA
ncbi:MAG TPA: chemotaxis protein CheX [bacterium]|nr:chemotaxis protein CheX [bacterium]